MGSQRVGHHLTHTRPISVSGKRVRDHLAFKRSEINLIFSMVRFTVLGMFFSSCSTFCLIVSLTKRF